MSATAAQPRHRPMHPVVVRPAPRREPPFDDEVGSRHLTSVGLLDRRLPFSSDAHHVTFAVTRPPDRGGLPDPVVWGRRLLVGIIEAAGGRRPFQQLAPLLSPSVVRGMGAVLTPATRGRTLHWTHAATVRTVRVSEPCRGVAELAVTVQVGERTRAIALRAEAHQGAWRCTRLRFG
ncbi:MAG: Rv3235 family protein [Actinomycetota bacterium]|nr:Rv3235 family protein [Actinomycetota bacterium]